MKNGDTSFMANQEIFSCEDLHKTFISTRAVDGVSIKIYKGEIRGLIGENGSGKSTLVSIFAGILGADSGRMVINDAAYAPRDQIDANNHGVSIIVQEMSTIEGLAVSENIFLGREDEFSSGGMINKNKMNQRARQLLERFNITDIDIGIDVAFLSFEERKMIELVKSVYFDPQLFIIDETTTALSRKGRDRLFELINELKDKGCSIIFISHDLEEVIEVCDTITVLRDGKVIDTIENENISEHDLKNMMVGRETEGNYYRDDFAEYDLNVPVLEVSNLSIEGELEDISFTLHGGEILGIGGLTNSGMHELGKAIFGAKEIDSGHVALAESGKKIRNIQEAIKNSIGYVPKNRDQEGLMLLSSIRDNISLPSLSKIGSRLFINLRKEKRFTSESANQLNVKMSSIEQFALFLSGGNKQKVVLAKWLSRDADILILDCPTRGIDVMVKAAIYQLMRNLKKSGKSIIMISEELLELIGMCDRILILKNGRIAREFKRDRNLTEESVIKYMI
jgi:ribose transport system ATP-binding protein